MSQSRDPELVKDDYPARQAFIKLLISSLSNYTLSQLEQLEDAITFEIWDRDPNVKKE